MCLLFFVQVYGICRHHLIFQRLHGLREFDDKTWYFLQGKKSAYKQEGMANNIGKFLVIFLSKFWNNWLIFVSNFVKLFNKNENFAQRLLIPFLFGALNYESSSWSAEKIPFKIVTFEDFAFSGFRIHIDFGVFF